MGDNMIKINFVCHGNICRSPMAEYVFKNLVESRGVADKFYITSSAVSNEEIGNGVHYGTRSILREKGIPCGNHRATRFQKSDYDKFDYIILMDKSNRCLMNRILETENAEKVYNFLSFAGIDRDIADPWYTGDFEQTYLDIDTASKAFFEYLERKGI